MESIRTHEYRGEEFTVKRGDELNRERNARDIAGGYQAGTMSRHDGGIHDLMNMQVSDGKFCKYIHLDEDGKYVVGYRYAVSNSAITSSNILEALDMACESVINQRAEFRNIDLFFLG